MICNVSNITYSCVMRRISRIASVRGAVLTAPAHHQSAFEGQSELFVFPRLPDVMIRNYTIGLQRLQGGAARQVDQLLNTTLGGNPLTSSSIGVQLQYLHRHTENYKEVASTQEVQRLHLTGSLSTGSPAAAGGGCISWSNT